MPASRSGRRRRFDDDDWTPPIRTTDSHRSTSPASPDEAPDPATCSTHVDARRGPAPPPAWLVTDPRAVDVDRGVLKTGKEAEVSLLERRLAAPDTGAPDTGGADTAVRSCLLAVKRYRDPEHRLFHRDAGYLEGRRVRRTREMRAMATRTSFGRDLISGQWAAAEFDALCRLWVAGAAVPYPVQLLGTELMMELVGDPDGAAAPRLAQLRPGRREAVELYRQLRDVLRLLAEAGWTHGDLSAYNVLVHDGRLVLIDLPQVVDVVANPQGRAFLRRDCANICSWFAAHEVPEADEDDLEADLLRCLPGWRD